MDDEIVIKPWVKRGIMLVNTEYLDFDDPDHIYNQILALGKRPEDYGYKHPLEEEYSDKSRGELIAELITLRKEYEAMSRYF